MRPLQLRRKGSRADGESLLANYGIQTHKDQRSYCHIRPSFGPVPLTTNNRERNLMMHPGKQGNKVVTNLEMLIESCDPARHDLQRICGKIESLLKYDKTLMTIDKKS